MLKKRLFGAEGEAEGGEDEGLAAVISTPEAPILTPPPKRGNWGNQTEKPGKDPTENPMEIEMGNQSGNQGNQSENQGNQLENLGGNGGNPSENLGGNQGNGGNGVENAGEEGTGGKGGARGYFMFLGDTVPSFYRRPHSSFDGLLTAIPCGTYGPECPN